MYRDAVDDWLQSVAQVVNKMQRLQTIWVERFYAAGSEWNSPFVHVSFSSFFL